MGTENNHWDGMKWPSLCKSNNWHYLVSSCPLTAVLFSLQWLVLTSSVYRDSTLTSQRTATGLNPTRSVQISSCQRMQRVWMPVFHLIWHFTLLYLRRIWFLNCPAMTSYMKPPRALTWMILGKINSFASSKKIQTWADKLGCTRVLTPKIFLSHEVLIRQKPYRVSTTKLQVI